jgi:hypothetical protein
MAPRRGELGGWLQGASYYYFTLHTHARDLQPPPYCDLFAALARRAPRQPRSPPKQPEIVAAIFPNDCFLLLRDAVKVSPVDQHVVCLFFLLFN